MTLQRSWVGSVVSFLVLGLAACGGSDGANASKCADGMLSSAPCSAAEIQSCTASGRTATVSLCVGGQWSRCGCAQSIASGSQTSPQGTSANTSLGAAGSVCGNARAEADEQCDGIDLKGMTCATIGRTSGTLKCNSRCAFDTVMCVGGSFASGGTGALPGNAVPAVPMQQPSTWTPLMLSGMYELEEGFADAKIGGTVRVTRYQFRPNGTFDVCRRKRTVVVDKNSPSDKTVTELEISGAYTGAGESLQLLYNDGTGTMITATYDASAMRLLINGMEYPKATRMPNEVCHKPGT